MFGLSRCHSTLHTSAGLYSLRWMQGNRTIFLPEPAPAPLHGALERALPKEWSWGSATASEHPTVHLKHWLVEPGDVQTLPGRGCLRMFNQSGIYKWDKHIHTPCLGQPMKLSCKHPSVLFTAMIQAYHHFFPTCCYSDSPDNGSDSTPDFPILDLHSQDITLIGSLEMQPTTEEALGVFPGEFWEAADIYYIYPPQSHTHMEAVRIWLFWSPCTW